MTKKEAKRIFTPKTRKLAIYAAKSLADKMKIGKWKIEVTKLRDWLSPLWDAADSGEGWGYSYCIKSGYLTVLPELEGRSIKYVALLSTVEGATGSLAAWSNSPMTYKDPNKAVAEAVKTARRYLNTLIVPVEAAEALLTGKSISH